MAVLVINDVTCDDDLVALTNYLIDAIAGGHLAEFTAPGTLYLNRGPSSPTTPTVSEVADIVDLDGDYSCTNPHHREGCTCVYDAAHTDPRQLKLLEALRHDGPVPYVRCSKAGTHHKLTDCWMCWSDVQRGSLTELDVLAS